MAALGRLWGGPGAWESRRAHAATKKEQYAVRAAGPERPLDSDSFRTILLSQ
jgi:hypothetical protein